MCNASVCRFNERNAPGAIVDVDSAGFAPGGGGVAAPGGGDVAAPGGGDVAAPGGVGGAATAGGVGAVATGGGDVAAPGGGDVAATAGGAGVATGGGGAVILAATGGWDSCSTVPTPTSWYVSERDVGLDVMLVDADADADADVDADVDVGVADVIDVASGGLRDLPTKNKEVTMAAPNSVNGSTSPILLISYYDKKKATR